MIELCTNKIQSDRLLKLGISEFMADVFITPTVGGYIYSTNRSTNSTVAFSTSKLMNIVQLSKYNRVKEVTINIQTEIVWVNTDDSYSKIFTKQDLIDNLIDCIEYLKLIKEL